MNKQHIVPIFLLMAFALLVGACTAVPGAPMAEQAAEAMPEPVPDEITIMDARSRPSPMAAGNGAAYMLVLNGFDQDVQLFSASSPAAGVVELHETVDDNGVMRMVPQPDGFTIPAGGTVELKPGGKHVMLIDLVEPLQTGAEIELTLNFDNGESFTLTVPVVEMDGMPMNMEMGEGEMEMEATATP